jgi:hypothetical protein
MKPDLFSFGFHQLNLSLVQFALDPQGRRFSPALVGTEPRDILRLNLLRASLGTTQAVPDRLNPFIKPVKKLLQALNLFWVGLKDYTIQISDRSGDVRVKAFRNFHLVGGHPR